MRDVLRFKAPALLITLLLSTAIANASIVVQTTPDLPGGTCGGCGWLFLEPLSYGGGQFVVNGLFLTDFQNIALLPAPPHEIQQYDGTGTAQVHLLGSFFDVFFDVDFASVALNKSPGQTGVFQTEMLAMNLTSASPVLIRESPSLPSLGQAAIIPLGPGVFRIDSFFDVFTELSIDGGQSWIPSDGPPDRMILASPEPSAMVLFSLGLAGLVALKRRRKV